MDTKGLRFEWDEIKAEHNVRKHHVLLAEAATVFGDALSITIADTKHSRNEDRYVTLGVSDRRGC